MEALKNMNKAFSKVLRDGEWKHLASEEIVPGDIVKLEAGDIVPADMRLLTSASLKIEEAALTGESVPAEKDADKVVAADAPLGDRADMAYSGGTVAYGRGTGVVTHTGMSTEVGKIATMLTDGSQQTSPAPEAAGQDGKTFEHTRACHCRRHLHRAGGARARQHHGSVHDGSRHRGRRHPGGTSPPSSPSCSPSACSVCPSATP